MSFVQYFNAADEAQHRKHAQAGDHTESPASDCQWIAHTTEAAVQHNEGFLHHVFDGRGAMALAPRVATDVGLQLTQHAVDGSGVACLSCGEYRPVDADHRGPSRGLRPAMAQA